MKGARDVLFDLIPLVSSAVRFYFAQPFVCGVGFVLRHRDNEVRHTTCAIAST